MATASTVFLLTAMLATAADRFELRGTIKGDGEQLPQLRVTLFGVQSPFSVSVDTAPGGRFHFRGLEAGPYSLSIVRSGLGEIRRSVAITPALAGDDGVVEIEIPYSAGEAANNPAGGRVSLTQLTIPAKAHDRYREAQERLGRRDTRGAVQKLQQAVEISPEFSAAWNALGVIAFQSGQEGDAERYYRRALEAEPGAFEASLNLGAILLRHGSNEEALAFNWHATRERPEDALANAQLGMNYLQLGKLGLAEEFLLAAKRIDPGHFSQPQLFLADVYARRGDRSAAVMELEDLIARNPDGPLTERLRANIERLRVE